MLQENNRLNIKFWHNVATFKNRIATTLTLHYEQKGKETIFYWNIWKYNNL